MIGFSCDKGINHQANLQLMRNPKIFVANALADFRQTKFNFSAKYIQQDLLHSYENAYMPFSLILELVGTL